ncbi:MAG: DUF3108 domain-containing protein [Magnetovibrionaceae bacterium]
MEDSLLPSFKTSILAATLGFGALLAPNAIRAEVPQHLRFEAYFGGLHVADVAIDLTRDEETRSFKNGLRVQTRGLADWVFGLRAKSDSMGSLSADGPLPDRFVSAYTNSKREREIATRFRARGDLAESQVRTWEAPDEPGIRAESDRPAPEEIEGPREDVTEDMRRGVIDPLSGLVAGLEFVADNPMVGKRRSVPVFDGKRRYDMVWTITEETTKTIDGEARDVWVLTFGTDPLAGFRKKWEPRWREREFELFIAKGDQPVPLQIWPKNDGPVVNLVEICQGPCPLPDPSGSAPSGEDRAEKAADQAS